MGAARSAPGRVFALNQGVDVINRGNSRGGQPLECVSRNEAAHMTPNEAAIRKAYQVAEGKDIAAWVNCFTAGGTFTDESIGVTYRGDEFGRTVEV
jgi:hypothetical protein